MSTTNPKAQETAEKKTATRTGQTKTPAGGTVAPRPPASGSKGGEARPVKEANAPRASLLDVYFGEGPRTAQKEVHEAARRPSRVADRRPAVETARPAAELDAISGAHRETTPRGEGIRPVTARPPAGTGAAGKTAAPRRKSAGAAKPEITGGDDSARRSARPPVAADTVTDAAAADEVHGAEARPAETAGIEAPSAATHPGETHPGETYPDETHAAETNRADSRPADTGPEDTHRTETHPADVKPAARKLIDGALTKSAPAAAAPRPIRPPARPRPAAEIVRPGAPGTRPVADTPVFVPRPVTPTAPPQRIVKTARPIAPPERAPGPTSGLGPPVPAGSRPAGGLGRPMPPGSGRGPRPGAGRTRPLTIPKVDPKVAEQQKQEAKRPTSLPERRRERGPASGDTFDRRSRPSEEKLWGRRAGRAATVSRRITKTVVTIEPPITVKELAHEMGITAAEVIKKLLGLGMMVTINQELDADTAQIVAGEFDVQVNIKEPEINLQALDQIEDSDEPDELKAPRPPVVVIMGHVDHGKTSLLDAIREARVAVGEAGGITQHIGAYQAEIGDKKITFLDTPGHEAFTAMRARGAQVTDIAILVVAADDGVMPQTVEAINHAKAAGVPLIVAINKIDKSEANPDRIKTDLTQYGLVVEEWGGDVIAVPVSAKLGQNLDTLLENVLLVAEVADLRANPDKEARGTILESELDKGRGPVGTVLVQAGTLEVGNTFVCGATWGKVRAMFDDRGKRVKKAPPSMPVQVLGFDAVPEAGDVFRVLADEKVAKDIAARRAVLRRAADQQQSTQSLEDFMKAGEIRDLNIIIKGDVMGSVEAVRQALEKLENAEARVNVVHGAVGAVTESDVMLAATSNALIIAFNVRPDDRAATAARQQNVDIRPYRVIYEAVDDVKAALTGMLTPTVEEVALGKAVIKLVFRVPKIGNVAGSQVLDGKIERNAKVRLLRDNTVLWEGGLASLKRFKDDVREVTTGQECGIGLDGYNDIKEGDVIEAYTLRVVQPTG